MEQSNTQLDLVDVIRRLHERDIARIRSKMDRILQNGGQVDRPGQKSGFAEPDDHSRRWQTITDPPNEVRVGFAYADISDALRPGNSDVVLVFQPLVMGYRGKTMAPAVIPDLESEAWAQALLGAEWSRSAYRVDYPGHPGRSRKGYPVVVSQGRGPIPSPIDLLTTDVILFRDRKLGNPVLTKLN